MTTPARPRAFRLTPDEGGPTVTIEDAPDPFVAETLPIDRGEAAVEVAQDAGVLRRTLWSWSGLFWSSFGALVSLGIGLWVDRLIEDLFARWVGLGWVGVAILALLVLAVVALAFREIRGVARQRKIAALHQAFAAARAADARDGARQAVGELAALYALRPATAAARTRVGEAARDIVDGRDLVDIAERSLMTPLDETVRREIAAAARRVSVVTAISPRALLDVIFVLAQAARLIRRIAETYGGRPGLFGMLRLARSVATHLAVTGGMAVGDSLVQQVLGHGIAARLSARLGEGVLNGLLTARVGLSAMAVCRPMPFAVDTAPGVKDVAPFLFSRGSTDA